jgi:hypothetical protein
MYQPRKRAPSSTDCEWLRLTAVIKISRIHTPASNNFLKGGRIDGRDVFKLEIQKLPDFGPAQSG